MISKQIHKIFHWTLDLIFPKYCLGCGKENSYVCQDCLNQISISSSSRCFICGHRSPRGSLCKKCKDKFKPTLKGLLVSSDWNNLLLRQIIYEYKYRFVKELADPLAHLMINFLKTNKLINPHTSSQNMKTLRQELNDLGEPKQQTNQNPKGVGINLSTDELVLIPVPLHKRRLNWRGFNQAQLLAQKISTHFDIPLENEILKRSRSSLPQVEIKNKNERRKNITGVFKINNKFNNNFDGLKNKKIILVDDICTTGSTLEECAKTLKPLGPKEIWALTIARG